MQCNAEAARWLACARQDKALARFGRGKSPRFENLIRLQAALNAAGIKYRLTSIATRTIRVRGESPSGLRSLKQFQQGFHFVWLGYGAKPMEEP